MSLNYVDLSARPKIGIPVLVEQYEWNNELGEYSVCRSVHRRPLFTGLLSSGTRLSTYDVNRESILFENIDDTDDEFIVTFSGEDPRLILNKQYIEEVGTATGSGLDVLGYTTGAAAQQFHTTYSPIDETMSIDVFTYMTSSGVKTSWTTIPFSGVFSTSSGVNQVRVDTDLGIIEFGDPEINSTPAGGSTVGVHYWTTMRVEYEPDYTTDTVVATEASLNPIYRRSGQGFVFLRTVRDDPSSIELRADLAQMQPNVFGPLYIGNTLASIIATVKDSNGLPLDGQSVRFMITSDPAIGSFGGSDEATSPTDQIGEARVFYNPPRGVSELGENILYDDVGEPIDDPLAPYDAYDQITKLYTHRLVIEDSGNEIFLYQVHIDDVLLGYLGDLSDPDSPSAQMLAYYTAFFAQEDIFGPTGQGDITRAMEWEEAHRMVWNLCRPTYFVSNQGMGRRQLCAVLDASALNPHTFEPGAVAPMQPVDVLYLGEGDYEVVFDTSSHTLPRPTASSPVPSGTLHSYFLVAPTTVSLQAGVFNERLNREILSNTITLRLRIPSYLSGLWILDAINQAEIDEVTGLMAAVAGGLTASGQRVPLGFRLKSSRVTLAAALDGVTFLDCNVVTSGVVGHMFNMIGGNP